jgi:glycosyltransferase involved in cell wall biosynthesis
MPPDVTVVIAARNAGATIERAVRSALHTGGPIVLVDDHSEDDTAVRARAVGGHRLTVVSPEHHETIGRARQTGIEAVTTRFAMWVDADDEAMPGRADRLLSRLEREGADIVFDAADLHDGATGAFLRHMPIPGYLQQDPTGVRQFERNVIPSLGWPLVRTSWAERVGYDPACHGVEDYDFLLRSVMEGARIAYEPTPGYRQYAYPASVSRELASRREGVRTLLQKHEYGLIRARYGAAGHSEAITAWALVAVAMYREDWAAAGTFIDEAAAQPVDPARVLEPAGPCPHPEGWRRGFHRGTLALLTGRFDIARRELTEAQRFARTPESSNNLGVALARFGQRDEAEALFVEAEQGFPSYVDASNNRVSATPSCITSHPLRHTAARVEYPSRRSA